MNDASTSVKSFVTYVPDPKTPYSSTPEGEAELARLQAMRDEDIDYSDIPPAPATGWMTAEEARAYRRARRKAAE